MPNINYIRRVVLENAAVAGVSPSTILEEDGDPWLEEDGSVILEEDG